MYVCKPIFLLGRLSLIYKSNLYYLNINPSFDIGYNYLLPDSSFLSFKYCLWDIL